MQLFTVPQLPMEGPQDMLLGFPGDWDVQVHNMVGTTARPPKTGDLMPFARYAIIFRADLSTIPIPTGIEVSSDPLEKKFQTLRTYR